MTGEVDPETGYVIDMKDLADLIHREVELPFDHKNLNLDVPEFKELIPSAEHIVYIIYQKMRPQLSAALDLHITLWETPRNAVSYPA